MSDPLASSGHAVEPASRAATAAARSAEGAPGTSRPRAVIVGAGIGGLTAAIALRRAGIEPVVYERVAELRPAGAGLTLAANAGLALRALGVLDAIRARGAEIDVGEGRGPRGERLQRTPIGEIGRELGVSMIGLHRAALQEVLLDALGRDRVRLGRECVGFTLHQDGVVVRFANGDEVEADLLIGADGLHSVVRRQLHGETPVRYAGYTSWRGVVEGGASLIESGASVETWGPGRRFGMVPIGEGRAYWFATANAPRGTSWRDREALLSRFGGWHPPIAALIEATDPERLIQTDIVDRPPIDPWGRGCVTLLGDAAHPMTPNLGQGACQAIEDALVLANCLGRGSGVEAALWTYERLRQARTAEITRQSLRFGRLGQLEHPMACRIRNAALRLTPAGVALRQIGHLIEPGPAVREALSAVPGSTGVTR